MPNAKDFKGRAQRILLVGEPGSGKTTQFLTLPGRKFLYIFDPNALYSLVGHDIEYELCLPDVKEVDSTLKGFNKGARDDVPTSRREPKAYQEFIEDLNARAEEGFFETVDWVGFDSLTFLTKLIMDRQLYINNRYGRVEELADYRIVGSKEVDLFRTIASLPCNVMLVAHIQDFQDERTKRTVEKLYAPGQARQIVPGMFTNVWLCIGPDTEHPDEYVIQTRPSTRGFAAIRSGIPGLAIEEDVTIADFNHPEQYGIGKILSSHK